MIAAALAAMLAATPAPGLLSGVRVYRGHCDSSAHTSEGPSDADLSTRHRPMLCSSAVYTIPSGDRSRGFWQFQIKDFKGERSLGFAGNWEDHQILDVSRVYSSEPGEAEPVTDGHCKVFARGGALTGLMCSSMIDRGGFKRVNVVVFTPESGQSWR